jgi:hypothetical protein
MPIVLLLLLEEFEENASARGFASLIGFVNADSIICKIAKLLKLG